MKKIIIWMSVIGWSVSLAHAEVTQRQWIATQDGTTCNTFPYKVIYPNSACTDNGDGTVSISFSGSGGSPGGSSPQIQYNNSGSFGGASGSSVFASSISYSGTLQVSTISVNTSAIAPDSPIKIGTNGTRSSDNGMDIGRSIDNSKTGNSHAYADSSIITRTGTIAYNSYNAVPQYQGAGPYDHYVGFQSGFSYDSSGLINYIYDFLGQSSFDSTGNATNHYDFVAGEPTINSTGKPGNQIGFYIPNEYTSGTTGNWGIYGQGHSNYFRGLILGDQDVYYSGDTSPQLMINGPPNADGKVRFLEKNFNFWDVGAINASSRFGIKDINATEYLSILTGGNVGLSTISPAHLLDINGSLAVVSSSTFNGNIYISSGLLLNSSAGSNGQVLTSGGAGTIPSWINNVTAASPIYGIQISSPNGTFAASGNFTYTGSSVTLLSSGNNSFTLLTASNTDTTHNPVAVQIVSTGTSPALQIYANGSYGTTSTSSGGLFLNCTGGQGASGYCANFYSNAGTQAALGGNVNIINDNANWNEPGLYIQRTAGTQNNADIRIDAAFTPALTMVDTSQTNASAGKYQWSVHNGDLRYEGRNTANTAFDSSVVISSLAAYGDVALGQGYNFSTNTQLQIFTSTNNTYGLTVTTTSNLSPYMMTVSTSGILTYTGGIANSTSPVKSANYTMVPTDVVIYASAPANTNTLVITLPPASETQNQIVRINRVDVSTRIVNISVQGSDLISNTTGIMVLNSAGQSLELQSDGVSQWWPIRSPVTPSFLGEVGDPNSAAAVIANDAYCFSFTNPDWNFVNFMAFENGAAAGNYDIGIYANNGVRLASLGSTATPSAGVHVIDFRSKHLVLPPGVFWRCIGSTSATTTINRFGASNAMAGNCVFTSSIALPATLTFAGCSVAPNEYSGVVLLNGGPSL